MATTTSHRTATNAQCTTSTNNNSNSTVPVLHHQPQQQNRGSLLSLHRPRGGPATATSLLCHRRWGMCIATIVGLLLIVYQVVEVYWWRGYNIHDTEIDWDRGRTVTRRRPELLTTIEQDKDGKTTVRTKYVLCMRQGLISSAAL
jgi:hypothetical protein